MGYPNSVFSPAVKLTGDVVQASHVNDLQTEVTAIETAALTGSWTVPNQPRMTATGSSTAQTISSSQSTGTRLQFPNILFDVGGGWSTTTNRYTVLSSGAYLVDVAVNMAAGEPAGRLDLWVNDVLQIIQPISTLGISHSLRQVTNVNASAAIHVGLTMNSTVARQAGVGSEQYQRLMIVKLC